MKRLTLTLIFALASTAHAGFKPVKRDNLLLYYPMLEGSGTEIKDSSNFRSTGTLVGSVAWVRDPGGFATDFGTKPWTNLIDGSVFLPNTAGVRLETAPLSRLNFNAAPFSILFEMSIEPACNNCIIMYYIGGSGAGCGGLAGWGLWQQLDGGAIKVSMANCNQADNYRPATADAGVPDRFTHMWLVTRSGNTLVFYRDGKLIGTATMAGDFGDAGTQILNIGDAVGAIAPAEFVGKFGTIAIWNTTLTADDAKAMWESKGDRRMYQ